MSVTQKIGRGLTPAEAAASVPGSESHLFSRLYLENMVKSAAAAAAGQSFFYYLVLSMCYTANIFPVLSTVFPC